MNRYLPNGKLERTIGEQLSYFHQQVIFVQLYWSQMVFGLVMRITPLRIKKFVREKRTHDEMRKQMLIVINILKGNYN